MNRKERTKTFMAISKWKNPWSPKFIRKYFSALKVKWLSTLVTEYLLYVYDYSSFYSSPPPPNKKNINSNLLTNSLIDKISPIMGLYWSDPIE